MRWAALFPIVGALALQQRDIVPDEGPNAAGPILGIYAMCGDAPVDCGQGWCCLNAQTCVTGQGGHIACQDTGLLDNNQPATVNAAWYGSTNGHQTQPPGPSRTFPSQGGGDFTSPPGNGGTTIVIAGPGASNGPGQGGSPSVDGGRPGAAASNPLGAVPPASTETIFGSTDSGPRLNTGNISNALTNISNSGAIVMSNDAPSSSQFTYAGAVLLGGFTFMLTML